MDTTDDPTRSAPEGRPAGSRWSRRGRRESPAADGVTAPGGWAASGDLASGNDGDLASPGGTATTGGVVTAGDGASGAVVPASGDSPRRAATDRGGGPAEARGRAAASANAVGWTALLLAVVLTVWLAVYELAHGRVGDPELYESISLFVSLILALSAAVLGIVALAQRRGPRWPGLAGLAVGLHVFVVAVFSWIGTLT